MICTLLSLYALFFSYFGVTGPSVVEAAEPFKESSCQANTMPAPTEQTLVIVKPDGVQRGLVGTIISRFEQKGFKLVAMKLMQVRTLHAHILIYSVYYF